MLLARKDLEAVDLERLRPFVRDSPEFYGKPGVEHYRLLAYLSTFFQGRTLIDIGTHRGESAHALSYNASNHVESFDIVDELSSFRRLRSNITYHVADLFEPGIRAVFKQRILESALIFVDVDPHAGLPEYEFLCWLEASDYEGIVVFDDIWFFKPMRNELWHKIDDRWKTDVTRLGHWSGTGIVSFKERIEHDDRVDTSNWTLVTGYFDLTGMPDATAELKARPPAHYLDEHSSGTLSLAQNLVVFCEPEQRERILAHRPAHLRDRTRIVTMSFDDFPLTKHRDRVLENRGGPCASDSRNTASYYLFCMARLAMLKRAIRDNPFGSTHFAWINICIERMGFRNLVHLDEALAQQRDKFSTCYIDYVPKHVVQNLSEYFAGKQCLGRCSMCSGFFTGNAHYMWSVCEKLEEQFLRCLEAGYGHADEQLFNLVYFEHPELFDWYCGDYGEMITNYAHVYERPESPVVHLIRNSLEAEDWDVCARACGIVYGSYVAGKCMLSEPDLDFLVRAKQASERKLAGHLAEMPLDPK